MFSVSRCFGYDGMIKTFHVVFQVLILYACKYLGEKALDALHRGRALPELRELDLSYGGLGRSAIEGVFMYCPQLMHVSLNGCAQITDFLWAQLSASPLCGVSLEDGGGDDVGMEDAGYFGHVQGSLMDISTPRDDVAALDMAYETSIMSKDSDFELPLLGHTRVPTCQEGESSLSAEEFASPAPATDLLDCPDASWRNVGRKLDAPEFGKALGAPMRLLRTLNCVGCPNIRVVHLLRSSACPYLSSIDLSLTSIREVRLSCWNLTSLKLR